MEYSRERMRDLMRAYGEYLASCDYIYMPDVYKTIVNMPSQRFWVSESRAAVVVSAMLRGVADLDSMCLPKKEMFIEIYRRVMKLREESPEMKIQELCAIVVEQPAPKFYLAPGSAKTMVCKEKRQWQKEKRKKLHLL